MNDNSRIAVLVAAAVVVVVAFLSFFTLNPTQQALVVQFGAPQAVVTEPGLHGKLPWQSVHIFDKRLLTLDAPSEEVIAQDKKRLVVDAFARWRIVDPLRFYQTLLDQNTALVRLTPILSSNVRRVLGSQSFAAMLSGKRGQLMRDIRNNMNKDTATFGLTVVDVRIRHADLPAANSLAIYQRMQKERQREANEYRAEGDEASQTIRARAEREVTVIVAEATRDAEVLRGEGDAEKTRVLGEAYGRDADFFGFYRAMRAYETSLGGDSTTVVVSPSSEFFKYFGSGGLRK